MGGVGSGPGAVGWGAGQFRANSSAPNMMSSPEIADADSRAEEASKGAIFQVNRSYGALHQGNRARHQGDLVTVVLVENTQSSKNVSSQTGRQSSFALSPPVTGPLALLNSTDLKTSGQTSFKGSGNASQNSSLNGAITVTIAEIRPNGTALIMGEKQMKLSQGDEWVRFAGIIRLSDISADNRIASSQVGDARMIYSGRGSVQRSSQPGWFTRFFSLVNPF